jgi:hypothetical protein
LDDEVGGRIRAWAAQTLAVELDDAREHFLATAARDAPRLAAAFARIEAASASRSATVAERRSIVPSTAGRASAPL